MAGTASPTGRVDKNSPSMPWEESQQAHGGTRALEASNFWIRNKPPSPVASERAKRQCCEPKMTKSRVSSYGPEIGVAMSTWSHSDILKTINHKASVQDPSSKSSGYQLILLKSSVYKHGRRSAKEIMKQRLASEPRGICGLDLILHFAFDGKQ